MRGRGFCPLPQGAVGLSGYAVRPAEWRLAQFLGMAELPDVATKFNGLMQSHQGANIAVQLSQLVIYRANGGAGEAAFWGAVRHLGETNDIPLADFVHMAGWQLDMVRGVLASTAHIPFNPVAWDAERDAQERGS